MPTLYSAIRWKAFNAKNHGAIGLIVVHGPAFLEEGEIVELDGLDHIGGFGDVGIPVMQINEQLADVLFTPMEAPLSMYHGEIERHSHMKKSCF